MANTNATARIAPIERPRGLLLKIVYGVLRREFGKVITPAKVVYARYPSLLFVARKLYSTQEKMKCTSTSLKLVIQYWVATLNQCAFCMDMKKREALTDSNMLEKFTNIDDFDSHSCYTQKEKAALAYVREITTQVTATEQTFEELQKHWDANQIIEITYVAAAENYMNRMTRPLGIGSDGLCKME